MTKQQDVVKTHWVNPQRNKSLLKSDRKERYQVPQRMQSTPKAKSFPTGRSEMNEILLSRINYYSQMSTLKATEGDLDTQLL